MLLVVLVVVLTAWLLVELNPYTGTSRLVS
jgi:hypothetical protein